jgi:hypothetical protein
MTNKRIKWFFIALILLALLIIILIFVKKKDLVKKVITKKAQEIGLIQPDCQIRNITFSTLNIEHFKTGKLNLPDFSISSLSIHYSPLALLDGKIKKVSLSGLQINLDKKDNKFVIRGLPTLKPDTGAQRAPIQVNEIVINSSEILINSNGRQEKVPVEGTITRGVSPSIYHFNLLLNPFGQEIQSQIDLNINTGYGKFHISSDSFPLKKIIDFFIHPSDFLYQGTLSFSIDGKLNGWIPSNFNVMVDTHQFSVANPFLHTRGQFNVNVSFTNKFKLSSIKSEVKLFSLKFDNYIIHQPLILNIAGQSLSDLLFKIAPFQISQPFRLSFKDVKGKVSLLGSQVKIEGQHRSVFPAKILTLLTKDLQSSTPLKVQGKYSILLPFSLEPITWNWLGKMRQPLHLDYPTETLKWSSKDCAGSLWLKGRGDEVTGKMELKSFNSNCSTPEILFSSKQLISKARFSYQASGSIKAKGSIKILDSYLKYGEHLDAQGVEIDFPWTWPYPTTADPNRRESGSIKIATLNISGTTIKDISGQIKQYHQGAIFSSVFNLPLPELKMDLSGHCFLSDGSIDLLVNTEIPKTQISDNISLAPLNSNLKGVQSSGVLFLKGEVSYKEGMENTHIKLSIERGTFLVEPSKLFVSGFEGELNINSISQLTSLPSQVIQFKDLNLGDIELRDGRFFFQLEGPDQLFIEKGEFKWCKGKILLHSFRYNPMIDSLNLTIFCDGIDFNEMLNLLVGDEVATGDGTLSGIIPLMIKGGNIKVADGYLNSTPGTKGNIMIKQSKQISGGVLIVEEAMKNFVYDSIKVKFNSVGDNLNIFVYINGVPKQKLPLLYNSKKKNFVRHPRGKGRVNLKGLLLELRFLDIDIKSLLKSGALLKYISNVE